MARPLEHNREEVIRAAMQVFWDKGYSATSMADLKKATGLNPGSIYASYQSKEEFFISTLSFYCDQSLENLEISLSREGKYLENIHTFFKNFGNKSKTTEKGCFFVNTLIEMAPHNSKINELLEHYTERYKSLFFNTLENARRSNQIPESTNIQTKSDQLMLIIWGLRVMQRSGSITESTEAIVSQQLEDTLGAVA